MVHRVAQDPGIHWIKDPVPAIEVPPDSEVVNGGVPDPAGVWPRDAKRSGLAGVVARVRLGLQHAVEHSFLRGVPGTGVAGFVWRGTGVTEN